MYRVRHLTFFSVNLAHVWFDRYLVLSLRRMNMAVYTLEQRGEVGLWSTYRRYRFWQKRVIFSDEAHFDLGGYVNKQNWRIWGTENPHVIIEKPTHRKLVTIWCRFWSRGIIRPFFFKNEQGEAVTVNGDRYRTMLNEFLFTKIEEEDIDNIWFQQDGATCHTTEATLDGLLPVFEDCVISRRADVVWPPLYCDLTPLDNYMCGVAKVSATSTSQRQLTL